MSGTPSLEVCKCREGLRAGLPGHEGGAGLVNIVTGGNNGISNGFTNDFLVKRKKRNFLLSLCALFWLEWLLSRLRSQVAKPCRVRRKLLWTGCWTSLNPIVMSRNERTFYFIRLAVFSYHLHCGDSGWGSWKWVIHQSLVMMANDSSLFSECVMTTEAGRLTYFVSLIVQIIPLFGWIIIASGEVRRVIKVDGAWLFP